MDSSHRAVELETAAAISATLVLLFGLGACQAPAAKPVEPALAVAAADEPVQVVEPVEPGDSLPELSFESIDGSTVSLASLRGRPAVIVFGSSTCPPFVRSVPLVLALERRFRGRVGFLLVYLDEAHPTDGWALPRNRFEVAQARSIEDRRAAADSFRAAMSIPFPVALDSMSSEARRVFDAFPNRMAIVDGEGRIVHLGPPGPGSTLTSVRTAPDSLRSVLDASPQP